MDEEWAIALVNDERSPSIVIHFSILLWHSTNERRYIYIYIYIRTSYYYSCDDNGDCISDIDDHSLTEKSSHVLISFDVLLKVHPLSVKRAHEHSENRFC